MTSIVRPRLHAPRRDDHKFSRGMVVVVQGAMPGAAMLAAQGAMHGGAGYVVLAGRDPTPGAPHALVRRQVKDLAQLVGDQRIGAILIGPGLGEEERWVAQAVASRHSLVIDGDALTAALTEALAGRAAPVVLTPHSGEFDRMFGTGPAAKQARTVDAARLTGAVIVNKGADTIISDGDRTACLGDASSWLSTAGTGDVLAGLIAARLACGGDALAAANEGVWLHARAARLAGAALIADDLIGHIPAAIAECL